MHLRNKIVFTWNRNRRHSTGTSPTPTKLLEVINTNNQENDVGEEVPKDTTQVNITIQLLIAFCKWYFQCLLGLY